MKATSSVAFRSWTANIWQNECASRGGRIEHTTVIAITKTRRNHHSSILLFRVHTVHFQNSLTPQSHQVLSGTSDSPVITALISKRKGTLRGVRSRSGEFSSWGSIRASFLLNILWLQAKKYSFLKQLPNIYLEHTKTPSNQIKWTESCCALCIFSS